MNVRYTAAVTLLVALMPFSMGIAQTALTPEQRAEVMEIIAQEREKVRQEEREAVLRSESDAQVSADSEHQVSAVSQLPPEAADSEFAIPREESSKAFFGPVGGNATFERNAAPGLSGFEIVTGTDAGRASIRYGRDDSNSKDGNGVFTSQALTASAPLDKKDPKYTNIATLDGLTNSFELAYSLSRYRMSGVVSPLGPDGKWRLRVKEICGISGATLCDEDSVAEGLKQKGKLDLLPEYTSYFEKRGARDYVYGFKVRTGHEQFEFFDVPSLEKQGRSDMPWGAAAFYGIVLPSVSTMVTGSVELQQSYKTALSATACPLPGDATYVRCVTGSLAPPQSKRKHLLSLEARRQFESTLLPDGIGVSLKVVHDFKNDETGVDLPLFLFHNDKNALNGGIRFGWSNTDQFSAGIFVGSDFKVIEK